MYQQRPVDVLLDDGRALAAPPAPNQGPDFGHFLRDADAHAAIGVLAGFDDPRINWYGPLFLYFLDLVVVQLERVVLVVRVIASVFMFFAILNIVFSFDIFHVLVDFNFLTLSVLFNLPIDFIVCLNEFGELAVACAFD